MFYSFSITSSLALPLQPPKKQTKPNQTINPTTQHKTKNPSSWRLSENNIPIPRNGTWNSFNCFRNPENKCVLRTEFWEQTLPNILLIGQPFSSRALLTFVLGNSYCGAVLCTVGYSVTSLPSNPPLPLLLRQPKMPRKIASCPQKLTNVLWGAKQPCIEDCSRMFYFYLYLVYFSSLPLFSILLP